MEDLRTLEERTGQKPAAGMTGETICPACGAACPAKWEEWTEGLLMMTFACPCGTALEFEEEAA